MLDDKHKKGLAAIIIANAKPKHDMKEEESEDVGLESAAEDILAAIEKKDVKALVESLKAFCQMCDEDYVDEEKSEEQ
jgi:KaiC/GvpD/RAD55 family RecA-like ATPase